MTLSEYGEVVEKTWFLVEGSGLSRINASTIAAAVSLPLAQVKSLVPDQASIVLLLGSDLLSKIHVFPSHELNEQEWLFDVMMQGFDRAQFHKKAIKNLWDEIKIRPWLWPQILPPFQKKIDSIIKNLRPKGNQNLSMVLGGYAVFMNTFLVWIKDETLDLSETMIVLDRSIKKYYEFNHYITHLMSPQS